MLVFMEVVRCYSSKHGEESQLIFYLMDHNALFHVETPLELGQWVLPLQW